MCGANSGSVNVNKKSRIARGLPPIHCIAATISLGGAGNLLLKSRLLTEYASVLRQADYGEEATMELKMRMDLLAVVMSFGFVAAIVLGVI